MKIGSLINIISIYQARYNHYGTQDYNAIGNVICINGSTVKKSKEVHADNRFGIDVILMNHNMSKI